MRRMLPCLWHFVGGALPAKCPDNGAIMRLRNLSVDLERRSRRISLTKCRDIGARPMPSKKHDRPLPFVPAGRRPAICWRYSMTRETRSAVWCVEEVAFADFRAAMAQDRVRQHEILAYWRRHSRSERGPRRPFRRVPCGQAIEMWAPHQETRRH
jgi:hypothetical protein